MRSTWMATVIGLGLLAGCGSEDPQQADSRSKEEADCVRGGLDQFDEGGGDPFWQREGRADFREFIVAVCREADTKGLLDGQEPGRELQEIAGRVILRMVERGQIRDPR